LNVQAQNFTRFTLREDFHGTAADLAVGGEALLRLAGVHRDIELLSAKGALDGLRNFHFSEVLRVSFDEIFPLRYRSIAGVSVTSGLSPNALLFLMSKPLQALIVEDSEPDAMLIISELGANGFEPSFVRVENAGQMETALGEKEWDVVIGDYSMPKFGALAALKLLRGKGFNIPFIAVSGTYGEEVAVEMMKAGANDYIVKDKLARLVPAIERELEAASERRARAKAETGLHYLAAIVESADDAIYGKTLDGVVVSWNKAAERTFGYSDEEMVGKSITTLFPQDRLMESEEILAGVKRGEKIGRFDTIRVRKGGVRIPVSITISPIHNGDGRVVGASGIARDISKRMRDDEERMKLIRDLTDALGHVKELKGLLPICASCKKIRDDKGYWQQVETYIQQRSQAEFTHGICPDCMKRLYPEYEPRKSS
jgi:PAS domain S-box-containing protein